MDDQRPSPHREDWSQEQLMIARKINRRGGSVEEALEAIGSQVTPKSAVMKFRRHGISFVVAPRMWNGTSKGALEPVEEVDNG